MFRQPSNRVNGNTIDLEGRVVSCETTGRKVVREELDGTITQPWPTATTAADSRRRTTWWSSPTVQFGSRIPRLRNPGTRHRRRRNAGAGTGPGISRRPRDRAGGLGVRGVSTNQTDWPSLPTKACYTSRIAGEPTANSATTSSDEIRRGPTDGASIENPAVLAVVDPGVPDGMRVDTDGNLYVAAGDGVQVFSPSGDLLGKILTPDVVTNCAFGMPDYQTLFIAATECVWKVRLDAAGAVQR